MVAPVSFLVLLTVCLLSCHLDLTVLLFCYELLCIVVFSSFTFHNVRTVVVEILQD